MMNTSKIAKSVSDFLSSILIACEKQDNTSKLFLYLTSVLKVMCRMM